MAGVRQLLPSASTLAASPALEGAGGGRRALAPRRTVNDRAGRHLRTVDNSIEAAGRDLRESAGITRSRVDGTCGVRHEEAELRGNGDLDRLKLTDALCEREQRLTLLEDHP